MEKYNKRRKNEVLRAQLELERASFIPSYRDVADHVRPRRIRFFTTDVNKGDRRNQKILNSTATFASRTGRAGMMGGITSPARPWFGIKAPDPKLNELEKVKVWLDIVQTRMTDVFLRSNLYTALPVVYGDLLDFATAAMFIEEDLESVLRCYPLPIGSYMISVNDKLQVDTIFREFTMTVRQLIAKWGYTNPDNPQKIDWTKFSHQVKNLYDQGNYETHIDVCHVIRPNEYYKPGNPLSQFKKYASHYYEKGTSKGSESSYFTDTDDERLLSEKGYDFFPALCPRWEVTGEDSYGSDCPGFTALGDIKQLQLGEKLSLQAIEKMVKPPMVADAKMRTMKASILPGDITYETTPGSFKAAHEVRFNIEHMEAKNKQVEYRIQRAYFEDLFLMMANSDRREITAREIQERHEEKLLALGPVLEQLNQDLLDPLIDLTFNFMFNQGLIPPPPEELQGMPLKVEYVSIMAQAQKLLGVSTIERFFGFVQGIVQVVPSVLDKVDIDQAIDVYGDTLSLKTGIIRSDDAVAKIREAQAQAQQAQQQMEHMNQLAQTSKAMSETKLDENSALTRLMEQGNAGRAV